MANAQVLVCYQNLNTNKYNTMSSITYTVSNILSSITQTPDPVPDSGVTALLLSASLIGIAFIARKFKSKK